jgi:hypothetical protein
VMALTGRVQVSFNCSYTTIIGLEIAGDRAHTFATVDPNVGTVLAAADVHDSDASNVIWPANLHKKIVCSSQNNV